MNLYKFTHKLLLKNDGQLKQKSDKQKKNHPIYQKIKRMSQKKSGLVKKRKRKKRRRRRKRQRAQESKKKKKK